MSNLNTKNNKFWKSSYLLRTEVKKAPQKFTDFAKIANENISLLRMKHPNKYSKNIKERGPLIVRKFRKKRKSDKDFHCNNNNYKNVQISKRLDS